jgi:hypothetical protein
VPLLCCQEWARLMPTIPRRRATAARGFPAKGPAVRTAPLVGNDTGRTWRHSYSPEDGGVRPFRSGWTNVPCRDEGNGPERKD